MIESASSNPGCSVAETVFPERRRLHRGRLSGLDDAFPGKLPGLDTRPMDEQLAATLQRMAELRHRNEQLTAVNSELRLELGQMTLRWIDVSSRTR